MNTTETTPAIFREPARQPLHRKSHEPATRPPRLGRWLLGAVLLIAAAILFGLLPRLRAARELRDQSRELAIASVSVTAPALSKPPAPLKLTAEVKPRLEAAIYSRANGYIKRWTADIGDEVEAGQLLAEVDTPELNQELAQVQAQLAQAEANLELSKTTAARWEELLKTASVSEQEAAEKQADLALKAAIVQAAQANVRRLEELQSFTRITAPFAGRVIARRFDVGDLVQATGGRELFRLAQISTLRVYAHVPQTLAPGIRAGQIAEVTIPELPKKVFKAKVVRTSGAIRAESRTLLTELELDNSGGEILAGSFAQVRFPEATVERALTVPANALMFRAEGTLLAFVKEGKIDLRKVTLGRDFGPAVEIVSGVEASDSVVLNPPDSLVDGMAVNVVASGAAK